MFVTFVNFLEPFLMNMGQSGEQLGCVRSDTLTFAFRAPVDADAPDAPEASEAAALDAPEADDDEAPPSSFSQSPSSPPASFEG